MTGERLHLHLFVVGAREGRTQPVPAEALGNGLFRVLHSPGFVEGIAAEDIIRVTDEQTGRFEVVERGGNLSIKVMGQSSVAGIRDELERELGALGGWCDGAIDRAAVFSVPVRPGLEVIEAVMLAAVEAYPDFEWYFGNVYEEDGVTPLGWWEPLLR